ncbi:MAG: hypothetical protein EBQ79_04580 [Actinobacteria bacterium]|nr:hypothetical protein [Micrococcales bacterium]NBX94814.1 hypothetical protein [Actinomycetota bacterium]
MKNTLSNLAIIFAGVSLLLFPPFFGLAAFILAIIGLVKKESRGVLALILSIVLPIAGMVIGALVFTSIATMN